MLQTEAPPAAARAAPRERDAASRRAQIYRASRDKMAAFLTWLAVVAIGIAISMAGLVAFRWWIISTH